MIWNDHKEFEGKHAFLGASQFRWINWDFQTLEERYYGQFAQLIGTTLHELAQDCINHRIKLNKSDKHLIDLYLSKVYVPKAAYDSDAILLNLIPFVNDAIGFHMSSEVVLYYSYYCFGTCDAICVNEKEKIIRIHDYKSGETPAHMEQLLIYAALYYLEYRKNPNEYKTILRIYQNFETVEYIPEPMEIEKFMKLIRDYDNHIQIMKGAIK